ncbi:MXAN_6230/SCO0854 family RING domain-containing protein [Micromonospora sp. NPDC050397]|uniref:MXAN_6230/SCO0854 family RING domain-containing protein n=1 Tax=Micromonospora sp. NPDC050397 TaxID=3364279 RepID=UPI00384EAB4D
MVGTGKKQATVNPVALALLRRSGLVAPGLLAGGRKVKRAGRRSVPLRNGLLALESDVLALGYLIGPRLRGYLAGQEAERLGAIGLGLLAGLESTVGADKPHVPLFRNFPRSVPDDTYKLYVHRLFALLLQESRQPCVLCGEVGTVHLLNPCAHLVCVACWDLGDYSGCPICHGRIDLDNPFLERLPQNLDDDDCEQCRERALRLARPVGDDPERASAIDDPDRASAIGGQDRAAAGDGTERPSARRLAVLELVDDLDASVYRTVATMLARRTPLSPQDRDDLCAMLDHVGHGDLGWLPDGIPVRETRAMVLGRLVADPGLTDRVPDLVNAHIGTATDALRLLYVLGAGDPGLVTAPPKRPSLSRRLRRILLSRLAALPLPALVEDLHRHGEAWLRLAENLHPYERAARHPAVAAAFATLRGTSVDTTTDFGRLLAGVAAEHPAVLRLYRGRLRTSGWAARVETALVAGKTGAAVDLLAGRPGMLARRLVELAYRTDDPEALLATAGTALRTVSPGVLVAALGAVRAATWPAGTRLYFPRGGRSRLWTEPDNRPRLAPDLGAALESTLSGELLGRAAELPPVEVALLDAGLVDLVAPFAERTASSALVRLPRGSSQPLPDGRVLRLFLHWTEPTDTRVDLDLSVAMYDAEGGFVGWCDYTRLQFGERAAVHSGDLTSAPAPLGASEFVDLDVVALRKLGIRYLTMVVFSYNDVPFDAMTDAFAGFMADPDRGRAVFDPSRVEQRFDLTGAIRTATPLLIDLNEGRLRWVDAVLAGSGGQHSVYRYSRTLGRLTVAADRYFDGGRRISVWELACWHAAGRAGTVLVRHRNGEVVGYRRGRAEPAAAFAARLTAFGPPDEHRSDEHLFDERVVESDLPLPGFAALVDGDVELAEGARAYALRRSRLDAGRVELLDAADLVGTLVR